MGYERRCKSALTVIHSDSKLYVKFEIKKVRGYVGLCSALTGLFRSYSGLSKIYDRISFVGISMYLSALKTIVAIAN